MATKTRHKRGISLPWERRGAWLRGILAGPRWKIAVAVFALVLAAGLIWRGADRQARVRETRAVIAEAHRAVASFRADLGRCPRSMTELLHPPRSGRRYLRAAPTDGWGRRLWVRCPSRSDADQADVISAGPSGSFFVDDNVR